MLGLFLLEPAYAKAYNLTLFNGDDTIVLVLEASTVLRHLCQHKILPYHFTILACLGSMLECLANADTVPNPVVLLKKHDGVNTPSRAVSVSDSLGAVHRSFSSVFGEL